MSWRHCTGRRGGSGLRVLLAAGLLSGCAGHTSGPHSQKGQPYAYAQSDLDELLTFGSDLAGMSDAELAAICREMRRRENLPALAGGGLVLHQMLGQLRYEECADFDSLVARVDSFLLESLPDFRTRQLVVMQAALLRRQHPPSAGSVKAAPASARAKPRKTTARPQPTPPAPRRAGPVDTPAAAAATPGSKPPSGGDDPLVRQKLEAIRAMEQQMDAAGAGR